MKIGTKSNSLKNLEKDILSDVLRIANNRRSKAAEVDLSLFILFKLVPKLVD